uniref:RING-type domain-containing protein n=1 Tax=Haptolina brevifila TaxID=156173 RepID=A0A7S2CWL4_9EUKA
MESEVERLDKELGRRRGDCTALSELKDAELLDALEADMLNGLRAILQRKEELRELKRQQEEARTQCIVCMSATRQTLFVPCGHITCCTSCGARVQSCPSCRSTIDQRVRAYV